MIAPRTAVNNVNHQPPLAVSTTKLSRKPPINLDFSPNAVSVGVANVKGALPQG
jgi:hypothetical protein